MLILLVTLIAIASIGFMRGSFMALIFFMITIIIGYFTNSAIALTVALLVAIASAIHKFDIIKVIKNTKQ